MDYKVINSVDGIDFPKVISLDTEYSEKNVRKATLLSISIGVSKILTYIMDDPKLAQEFIKHAELIYTWNGVVDFYTLSRNGVTIPRGRIRDAMLMEHLIDERLDHGLGDYALRNFNDNYKEEFWSMYDGYQEAPKEVAYEYEMRDGCYTYDAGERYSDALKERMGLVNHTHQLQWVLFDTEIRGIKVDRDLMIRTEKDMSEKIKGFLPKLRQEFNSYCNLWELNKWGEEIAKRKSPKGKSGVKRPEFSFTSDRQISTLIYGEDYLALPVTEKTKKGSPSTSFEALQNLASTYPILNSVVEYKDIKAVYATFVKGMLERVEENDRIHPTFFINGTATGRISHAGPNMGNLPKEGVIRNFFLPDAGHVLMGADYSQLEIVVEANLTEDPSTLKIILEGASKHDITAQGLGITRDQAKTLNFGLGYGAGVHKVSKILGISHSAAQEIFTKYWELYSGVRLLKEKTCKELADTGKVTNLFGRTRHFDKPKNEFEKAQQERKAYNFLVQGVGADITNMATYLIADEFKTTNIGDLGWSVHDEIVTQVKIEHTDKAIDIIKRCMRRPNEVLNFKYPVDCKLYGPLQRWAKT